MGLCLVAYEQLKFNAQLPNFKFSLQYKETLLELCEEVHEVYVAQFFLLITNAKAVQKVFVENTCHY